MLPDDWKSVRHFKAHEFYPDPAKASRRLVRMLDGLRDQAECEIVIHECWAKDGHSKRSKHYEDPCEAVDLHFVGLTVVEQYALLAFRPVIGAIGYYPWWASGDGWHIDLRDVSPRVLWVSPRRGVYRYGEPALLEALGVYSSA